MLRVVMMSVFVLNVENYPFMLSIVMLCVSMLSTNMLSVRLECRGRTIVGKGVQLAHLLVSDLEFYSQNFIFLVAFKLAQ